MTATVLCPGESIKAYVPNGGLVIGVNRAVIAHRCEWWAASDYPLIRDYDAGYPIKLFTNKDTKIARPERFTEVLFKESLPDFSPEWATYTATSALVLAAHLGAKRIDVYGVDWEGVVDWDGHQYSWTGNEAWRTRGGENWEPQIKAWGQTVSALREHGVSVCRFSKNTEVAQSQS